MRYLVDTNVISELCKKQPNENVISWFSDPSNVFYISAITIEELRFGEFMMPKGKKREQLHGMIDLLLAEYGSDALAFGAEEADLCAAFHERAIHEGRTPTFEDLAIASIAKTNSLVVATRNTVDFDHLDVDVFNPFDA